ncbi:Predicted DNA binding protein, contains HTH domain [Halogranum gelatinilyticum]|uniref:Predicted DNA binding protein, contains HTH domain n=1 Tax=Halogranum gelatinilyticum TaxID=660521 RepID=A0A1G9YG57_9EURY|nr:helix-turn-helix domain-containing protein [Halogranum gelatinilyticum]SDN07485.1 Predicted DNA binding protein, contains HTH domain [Halogranum gelatinilyticum]
MATVAEFTLPSNEFPLGTVFTELPDVVVQLERVIPVKNGVVPYFWVRGTESDSIVDQFSEHPGVRDIRAIDHVEAEYLLRCEWTSGYDSVLDALIVPEIVLLSAIGTAEEWTFELRAESREAIAAFRDYCHDHGVLVTLTEIHALRPLDAKLDLTDGQREALRLAYDRGYFNSPRDTTLAEMAVELDVSQQALGARLRRGNRRLIEQALTESRS